MIDFVFYRLVPLAWAIFVFCRYIYPYWPWDYLGKPKAYPEF